MLGQDLCWGLTDNSGNRFAVAKLLSTKWPLTAFVAELAVQLEARGILLEVCWVPRDQNSEADAITNGHHHWLAARNRIGLDLGSLPFLVLPQLLAMGEKHYGDKEAVNLDEAEAPRKDHALLKVRDPWDS